MQLQISVKDGALTAQVQTDNSTTRNLLLDNLPALRERLEQQDIRIERFEVNVQDRSSGGQPQMPDQNPDTNDTGRRFRSTNSSTTSEISEPTVQSGGLSLSGGGQLNVVI
jgi:flagellar hook-length control protein FliK